MVCSFVRIDPATGKELFLTEKGRITFTYDYADEVVVGNSEPDLKRVLGNSFYYKGFLVIFIGVIVSVRMRSTDGI